MAGQDVVQHDLGAVERDQAQGGGQAHGAEGRNQRPPVSAEQAEEFREQTPEGAMPAGLGLAVRSPPAGLIQAPEVLNEAKTTRFHHHMIAQRANAGLARLSAQATAGTWARAISAETTAENAEIAEIAETRKKE